MARILIPVDGTEQSCRGIEYLVKRFATYSEPPEVHLLNVQHALHGDVGMFIDSKQIREYHHDEGLKALLAARQRLDNAGIAYQFHIGVGEPGEVIVQYAKDKHFDEIIMYNSGRGSLAAFLLGSAVSRVLQLTDIPVVLVK